MPPPIIGYGCNSTLMAATLEERDAMLEVMKFQLLKAQARMKQLIDGIYLKLKMLYVKLRP